MSRIDPASLYRYEEEWSETPGLRFDRPVLAVALEGWVDAGMSAGEAVTHLLSQRPTAVVATFDTEPLIDQRARRPIARIDDGVTRELTWPAIRLLATKDDAGNDLLFLAGPEPDFLWPSFIAAVVRMVDELGIRMVVGLGAFPAPTPHTRPVRLASTVPPESADLAARIGSVHGTLEVPAGIQAALEVALGRAGVPVIGLWARVPHYVAAMSYPEASAALVEGMCDVAGIVLGSVDLRTAGEATRSQVDDLIAGNMEHLAMVRGLEQAIDAEEGTPLGFDSDLPSGDEIAAEFEQFLRDEGA